MPAKRDSDGVVRVGVVEKNRHSFWDSENAGWSDAAARLGLAVDIRAPAVEDIDAQRRLMVDLVDSGVDALAFVGTYPDAFDDIVAACDARGVPTVCFDLDAPYSGRKLYVGMRDPYEMGLWAARQMAALLPKGAVVGALDGSERAAGARGKMDGFRAQAADLGIDVVGGAIDNEDVDLARKNCEQLLAEHPDLDGLYGVYSYHTAIEAECVRDLPRPPVVFGWDLLPETIEHLRAGRVGAAVWIKEYYFGYLAATAVASLVRAGVEESLLLFGMDPTDLSGNTVHPEAELVTPATVEAHVAWRRARGVDTRQSALAGPPALT